MIGQPTEVELAFYKAKLEYDNSTDWRKDHMFNYTALRINDGEFKFTKFCTPLYGRVKAEIENAIFDLKGGEFSSLDLETKVDTTKHLIARHLCRMAFFGEIKYTRKKGHHKNYVATTSLSG